MISRVQGDPRFAARYLLTGVCHAVTPRFPGVGPHQETGGHDGEGGQLRPFCPSPLQPVGPPTQLPAFPQATHRHHHPSIQPRDVNHKPHETSLSASSPGPTLLPNAGAPPPRLAPLSRRYLNLEDGEGRGAKDTAGVHPRRLRRPHLGSRCRSRYVIPPAAPLLRGLVCTRAHCC